MTTYTRITSGGRKTTIEAESLADAIRAAHSKRTTVGLYLSNGFHLGVVMNGEFTPAF